MTAQSCIISKKTVCLCPRFTIYIGALKKLPKIEPRRQKLKFGLKRNTNKTERNATNGAQNGSVLKKFYPPPHATWTHVQRDETST